jgi:hypothetical protein
MQLSMNSNLDRCPGKFEEQGKNNVYRTAFLSSVVTCCGRLEALVETLAPGRASEPPSPGFLKEKSK